MHDDVCDSPFEDEGRLSETSAEIFTARVIEAAAIEVRSADAPRPRRRRECIKIYSPKRCVCSRRVAACATLVGGCPIAVRPVVRIHTFLRGLLPLERIVSISKSPLL
jgi:hypothetical protein